MNDKPHKIAKDFGVGTRPRIGQRRFLAIDPGDVHVGLAEFEQIGEGGWLCVWSGEMDPASFSQWYAEGVRRWRWNWVVCESWKLFPQAAPIYVGSDMPTSRLIGAIHALAAFLHPADEWMTEPLVVHMQDPQIKVPTRGWLKRRKMRSVAKILGVKGDHAQDGELHGYKWLIDHDQPVANSVEQAKFWEAHHLTPRHDLW